MRKYYILIFIILSEFCRADEIPYLNVNILKHFYNGTDLYIEILAVNNRDNSIYLIMDYDLVEVSIRGEKLSVSLIPQCISIFNSIETEGFISSNLTITPKFQEIRSYQKIYLTITVYDFNKQLSEINQKITDLNALALFYVCPTIIYQNNTGSIKTIKNNIESKIIYLTINNFLPENKYW
jgi:cell fate (sporulation/competence/biofilm development) regulator YmcA (YheA/YmcA/DUF963 family)